jgi:hypothetical protein
MRGRRPLKYALPARAYSRRRSSTSGIAHPASVAAANCDAGSSSASRSFSSTKSRRSSNAETGAVRHLRGGGISISLFHCPLDRWRAISTLRTRPILTPKFAGLVDQTLAASCFDFPDQPQPTVPAHSLRVAEKGIRVFGGMQDRSNRPVSTGQRSSSRSASGILAPKTK